MRAFDVLLGFPRTWRAGVVGNDSSSTLMLPHLLPVWHVKARIYYCVTLFYFGWLEYADNICMCGLLQVLLYACVAYL